MRCQELGNRIPSCGRVNRVLERNRATIPNDLGIQVMDVGAHNAATHQRSPVARYEVHVNVGAGEQSCRSFDQRSTVGDVDDSQLASGSQTHSRKRLVGFGRPPPGGASIRGAQVRRHQSTLRCGAHT